METTALWEKILAGVVVLLVLLWFRPGIRASLEQSRQAKDRDWGSVLFPIALVVLFVVFLIYAL